jgi:hypothetical protein
MLVVDEFGWAGYILDKRCLAAPTGARDLGILLVYPPRALTLPILGAQFLEPGIYL